MIIADLEHFEAASEMTDLEGSLASLNFNLEFLSLGSVLSLVDIPRSEFLTTESPGVNVASGKFTLSMTAVGFLDLELGLG